MNKEIVISAFDRDYSWINQINGDIKFTIYRKGNQPLNNEILIEPNVGRDVHSFFYHIVNNYDNLSDLTFFVQDYPFDHWENIVDTINGGINTINLNATLKFDGYFGYHFRTVGMWGLTDSSHFGGGNVLTCNSDGHPQDPGRGINVNHYWDILFDEQYPNVYEFIPGGHFGITKENIKLRSLDFYKKIINLLENEYISPWIIERLECYIFNKKYKTKL
jgi:hypothetical protein